MSKLKLNNLQKRGKTGPGIYLLCYSNEESIFHIFSRCLIWKCILGLIIDQLQLNIPPEAASISDFFEVWASTYQRSSVIFFIPHHAIWAIWKARNRVVFDGKKVTILSVFHQILNAAHITPSRPVTKGRKSRSAR